MSFPFQRAHFKPPAKPAERRALFMSSVSTIILELTEHCNRRCSYCPVSLKERLKNRTLSTGALEIIIRDLGMMDFTGSICLNLYNEPTADRPSLLSAIRKIREGVPKADIYFSTNGDYLTKEYIDAIFNEGLSRLIITLHVPPTAKYEDEGTINRAIAFSMKIGASVEIERFSPGMYLEGRLRYGNRPIKVYSHNFEKTGVDRAGSMTNVEVSHERNAPCMRPFETVTISYDGRMFPCCQFYPDFPENDRFSVGKVEDFASLFDAYCSPEMTAWRRSMFRYGPKASPCNTCLEADAPADSEQINERNLLATALGVDEAT